MLTLTPGQSYRIIKMRASAASTRRKLLGLGFLPGAELRVRRLAPWGGPVQLEINGASIGLRLTDLEHFFELEALPCLQ